MLSQSTAQARHACAVYGARELSEGRAGLHCRPPCSRGPRSAPHRLAATTTGSTWQRRADGADDAQRPWSWRELQRATTSA
jgi:hypothetical protein